MDEVAHRAEKVVQAHAHARGKEQGGPDSPMRPMARIQPVTMPSTEEGSTTWCESYATCPAPKPRGRPPRKD